MPSFFAPMSVQKLPAYQVNQLINIAQKNILEIAGNSNAIAANEFINLGAESVTITGLNHITTNGSQDNRIRIMEANALKLDQIFDKASFDVVYACSALEHISDIGKLIDQVRYVLKPGGVAWLEGDPIFSAQMGHHIWLDSKMETAAKARDKLLENNYFFNNSQERHGKKSFNPIPPWGHLLYTQKELAAIILKNHDIPDYDLSKILEWVYTSDDLNRFKYQHFRDQIFSAQNIRLINFSPKSVSMIPEEIKRKFLDKGYNESSIIEHTINGIFVIFGPE